MKIDMPGGIGDELVFRNGERNSTLFFLDQLSVNATTPVVQGLSQWLQKRGTVQVLRVENLSIVWELHRMFQAEKWLGLSMLSSLLSSIEREFNSFLKSLGIHSRSR